MNGVCRVCGCTDASPCLLRPDGGRITDEEIDGLTEEQADQLAAGACDWIEPDLCSACLTDPAPPLLYDAYGNPLRGAP